MIFNLNKFDSEQIKNAVYNNSKLKRYILFILAVLLQAIAFNIFILPCNLIFGVSGISIILHDTLNLTPSLVILIANVLLIIASFTFLGKDATKGTILGSIIYPVFIELTSGVGSLVDLENTETFVIALAGAILTGIGSGIVFREGFTTGGSDVLKQILSEYGKMSLGKATIYVEGVIIMSGLLIFGWQSFIYSIMALAVISVITDKVLIGISQYKTFQIVTTKEKEVKEFLLNQLHHGVTEIESHGAFTGHKQKILLSTLPTKKYFLAKEGILMIDPKAFFIVTDAYEVRGGE